MKTLLSFFSALVLFACQGQSSNTLSPQDFQKKLSETPNAVLLDVRTPDEFSEGFIAGARNLDWNTKFKTDVVKYNKDLPYFVYCLAGGRSNAAVTFMKQQGFTQVYELQGGVLKWQGAGLALTGASEAPADKISLEAYQKMGSSNKKVIIDFYAPWCGPCRKLEPLLNEIAQENKDIQVIRINVDENKALTHQLGFEEIPVIQFFQNGKLLKNHFGFMPKAEMLQEFK
jgi:thioredoxin 1